MEPKVGAGDKGVGGEAIGLPNVLGRCGTGGGVMKRGEGCVAEGVSIMPSKSAVETLGCSNWGLVNSSRASPLVGTP